MVQISLQTDLDKLVKDVGGLQRQVPFIAQQVANDLAFQAAKQWPRILKPQIDRPNRFTLQNLYVQRARRKANTVAARIGIKRKQAAYLAPLIEGGTRSKKPIEFATGLPLADPVKNLRKNKFGNVAKKRYVEAFEKAKGNEAPYFLVTFDEATPTRPAGIWRREDKRRTKGAYKGRTDRARPLFLFPEKPKSYKQQLDFYAPMLKFIHRRAPNAMRRAILKALRTSR